MKQKLKMIGAIVALALVACMAAIPHAKASGGMGWIHVQDNYWSGGIGGTYIGYVTHDYYGTLPGVGGLDLSYSSPYNAVQNAWGSYENNGTDINVSAAGGGMCGTAHNPIPCWMLN